VHLFGGPDPRLVLVECPDLGADNAHAPLPFF
jgi:hypothetical protein